MKVKRFEDLIAWQQAIDLAGWVYLHFREKTLASGTGFAGQPFRFQMASLKDLIAERIRASGDS